MSYSEEDYLMLSGIQHFAFCRRQWALIHIEQQWEENLRTMDGIILHEHVHNPEFHEKRGDTIITRAMAVSSSELGLAGECDAVEFHRNSKGISIFGMEGKYIVIPVEYKRGSPKEDDCDVVQLTAQALCLEDMLCCEISYGYLYYGETRHRLKVQFDSSLKERTRKIITEMHQLYQSRHTPKVKRTKSCNACSLKHICLPELDKTPKASAYLQKILHQEDNLP